MNANAARQSGGPPTILLNDLSAVHVQSPPPAELFELPLTAAQDLPTFRPDPLKARLATRIEGVVTPSIDATGTVDLGGSTLKVRVIFGF